MILAGLAVVAVAAVAAVLISKSSNEASGAADDQLFGIARGAPLDEADLQKMVLTRVGAVRFVLGWTAIEAQRGSFNWAGADQTIGGLASHGIEAFPSFYGSPPWISPDPARPPLDTAGDRAAWTRFVKAAVERYGPGGEYWRGAYQQQFGSGAPPVPITAWQIWNEPNLPHYYAPKSSPSGYAELLRLSRDAIIGQDPSAEIVLAGMPGYGKPDTAWRFLDQLYRQPGFDGDFDAVALHPYARTIAQLALEIRKLRAAMAEHGDGDTPLWLTELGWGSGKPNRFGLNKGLKGQAELLRKSFELIEDHRRGVAVATSVLVQLAGSAARESLRLQLLLLGRAARVQRIPKALLDRFQELHGRGWGVNPLVRAALVIALSAALIGGLTASLLEGSGGTTSSAAGAPSDFFGIVQGIRLDEHDFATMQATGVKTDRFLLFWESVQPRSGSFVWGPTDSLVGNFASHGIKPFPTVSGNPSWVPGDSARPPLDTPEAEQAWQDFLKALVNRYGPDGSYWAHGYREQYGADATPLPIDSWQIWNEPNLSKYFAPAPSAPEYAHLVRISHDAITSQDPKARIVLAGMPGHGEVSAWKFLDELYREPGFKRSFDVAALHPYAPDIGQLADQVQRVRTAIDDNGGRATPLWLTELGWGSGRPDSFGSQQGPGWPSAAADRRVQACAEPSHGLGRAETVLVRLA